jgi:hypothetical protein
LFYIKSFKPVSEKDIINLFGNYYYIKINPVKNANLQHYGFTLDSSGIYNLVTSSENTDGYEIVDL